ncbi:MAG: recombination regulator RecX [Oscillospiraceae bacterium]|nr:recombination regulator RecX [Oscillospiraceae bacterium]
MKLESIEETRQGKLRLHFADGSSMSVFPAVIAQLGLYSGAELSDDAMQELHDASGAASAKQRAVRIVAATAVSKNELKHRLVQKGESEEHASRAVSWLNELNLLDDGQLAQQVVRRGASKGYGAARIRQMLYEKRVPREYWDDALAQLPEQDETIDQFLRQRFREETPDRADIKRATDALLRRGHSWEDIRRALGRYTKGMSL